uniref:Ig-like domain-containing protein n=1 Tax=Gopherus agassizii TaxID=38772 RepID=A0A452GVN3_9SAUR
ATPAAPSLFPLYPSCEADASQDPVALGCLAKDFLPETIDFSWKNNTNTSITDGIKKFPSILNTAGTYIATTQLLVTASEAQGVFYCTATYPSGEETIKVHHSCPPTCEGDPPFPDRALCCSGRCPSDVKKETRALQAPYTHCQLCILCILGAKFTCDNSVIPTCLLLSCMLTATEPSMTIRPPARDQFLEPNKTSTIICSVKNLCNQAVTMKWLKDGEEISSGIHTVAPVSSGCNGYTLISELTVSEEDWDSNNVYSCKVESNNFSDIRNTSKCFECGGKS